MSDSSHSSHSRSGVSDANVVDSRSSSSFSNLSPIPITLTGGPTGPASPTGADPTPTTTTTVTRSPFAMSQPFERTRSSSPLSGSVGVGGETPSVFSSPPTLRTSNLTDPTSQLNPSPTGSLSSSDSMEEFQDLPPPVLLAATSGPGGLTRSSSTHNMQARVKRESVSVKETERGRYSW